MQTCCGGVKLPVQQAPPSYVVRLRSPNTGNEKAMRIHAQAFNVHVSPIIDTQPNPSVSSASSERGLECVVIDGKCDVQASAGERRHQAILS